MKKDEMIKGLVEELKAEGIKLSQKEVRVVLDTIENKLVNTMVKGDSVKVFGCKFETKEVAERVRTYTVGSKKGEQYTTPRMIVGKVKLLQSTKNKIKKAI